LSPRDQGFRAADGFPAGGFRPAASQNDSSRDLNVRAFCEEVCRESAADCMRQGVRWTLDIDPALVFSLPPRRTRRILEDLLKRALRRMPSGGHVDWTAVVTARGLEIEVADTGEALEDGATTLVRRAWDADAPQGGWSPRFHSEYHWCPQGGLAQTLVVPWVLAGSRCETYGYRRAA
jgi:hypothetical protein